MSLALYYSPGACSIAPHIALEEAGADFEARRIMLAEGQHRTPEYLALNPKGRVPLLLIDDQPLSELPAIVGFIGARFGTPGSVPQGDALAAARANEMLSWCGSTVHIGFAQVFRPERFASADHAKALQASGRENLAGYFSEIEERLAASDWLAADSFTAADSYVFAFYRWGRRIGMDMGAYPSWYAHCARLLDRPAVQRAVANEGLSASEWIGG